jgi:hypothetical protein
VMGSQQLRFEQADHVADVKGTQMGLGTED